MMESLTDILNEQGLYKDINDIIIGYKRDLEVPDRMRLISSRNYWRTQVRRAEKSLYKLEKSDESKYDDYNVITVKRMVEVNKVMLLKLQADLDYHSEYIWNNT